MISLVLLLGLVLAGIAVSYVIARFVGGAPGWAALAAWICVPFVALALYLRADIDPTLAADRAQYNLAFGLVLFSLLLAVPWLPANLAGALLGWRKRRAERNSATTDGL